MTKKGRSAVGRFVGISLFIIGLALILYFPGSVVYGGLLVQVAYIWAMTICIAVGSLMMVSYPLTRIAKAFLIVLTLGLPWTLLLFLPLPTEIQLWPAIIVALAAVLVYRHYYGKSHSSAKSSEEH